MRPNRISVTLSKCEPVKHFLLALYFALFSSAGFAQFQPDRFEVPFELHSNLIFIKASLDGKEKSFIFDSGAPFLVLNSDHFDKADVRLTSIEADGIGGKTEIGMYLVQSFEWGGSRMDSEKVVTMSLRHLEQSAKHEFAGLIGFGLFADFQITFDYQKKILSFVRTDFEGDIPGVEYQDSLNYAALPINMLGHIPTFPVLIGGREYKLGLDCGAGSNLIYAKYLPELQSSISKLSNENLKGVAKGSSRIKHAKVDTATVAGLPYYNMGFAFEDATLQQISAGYAIDMDGLLGYEFLKQRKTIVNYRKEMIFIERL